MQNVMKVVVLFLFLGLNIYAQESKFTTSIALVGMSMDYREYDRSGQILDSEESGFSDLAGFDMGIDYLLSSTSKTSTYLVSNLTVLGGDTVYTGSLLGSGNPYGSYIGRTVNNIIDLDIGLEQRYTLDSSVALKYSLGLGYRFCR